MIKPSKLKATRSLYIVLFVVFVSVISSVFFFSNFRSKSSNIETNNTNNITPTLETIPDCETTEEPLIFNKTKIFIDEYYNVSFQIPVELLLEKYPLDYLGDSEYLKEKAKNNLIHRYSFSFHDTTEGFPRFGLALEFKQDCNTASSCMEADIISRSKSDSQDLCKINKTVDGNIYTFLRSSSDKNPVSTSWNTYIDTSRGVMLFRSFEKGSIQYGISDSFIALVNSFKFTK